MKMKSKFLLTSLLSVGTFTLLSTPIITNNFSNETSSVTNLSSQILNDDNITIKINNPTLQITSFYGETGQQSYTAIINPSTINPDLIVWSIVDPIGFSSSLITVRNGLVVWSSAIPVGTYSFKLKAAYALNPTIANTTPDITLTIKSQPVSVINFVDPQLSFTTYTASQGSYQYQIETDHPVSYGDLLWELIPIAPINSFPTNKITINHETGMLSWKEQIPVGTYQFRIAVASKQSMNVASQTNVISFAVLPSDNWSVKINAFSDSIIDFKGQNGSQQLTYETKNTNFDLPLTAQWSLEPINVSASELQNVVWFDSTNSGLLCWSTLLGNKKIYEFNVVLTCSNGYDTKSDIKSNVELVIINQDDNNENDFKNTIVPVGIMMLVLIIVFGLIVFLAVFNKKRKS